MPPKAFFWMTFLTSVIKDLTRRMSHLREIRSVMEGRHESRHVRELLSLSTARKQGPDCWDPAQALLLILSRTPANGMLTYLG